MHVAKSDHRLEKALEEQELEFAFVHRRALQAGGAAWAEAWRCGTSQRCLL